MAAIRFEVGFAQDRKGKVVACEGERLLLGRAEDCAVSVESDVVSRHHAEVTWSGGRWVVRDLGSSNGTFLNRVRISAADLRPGDVIRLGEAGPKLRVLTMDPAPADDLQATRYLRAEPRDLQGQGRAPEVPVRAAKPPPEPAEPARTRPSQEARPARPAPPAKRQPPARPPAERPVAAEASSPPAPARRRLLSVFLTLVGLAFGATVGLNVYPHPFPYPAVGAPGFWATYGLTLLAPFFVEQSKWVLVVTLALYWGVAGRVLACRWRWPLLLLIAGGHAYAYYAMTRFG